jgi:hypothetical protein
MEDCKFRIDFLEEAKEFLDGLDENEIERAEKFREKYFNEKRREK